MVIVMSPLSICIILFRTVEPMELTDYVLTEEANRSLPCPSARRAVNKRFVHRERGPVKVAGCHFPGDKDDRLTVFHDCQEEEFGNYSRLSPGLTELVLAISSLSKTEK